MVSNPAVIPETIPEAEPTVAREGVLLLHIPVGIGSARVVVVPVQTDSVPVIAGTVETTVTVRVV